MRGALIQLIDWSEDYMKIGKTPVWDSPGSARQALKDTTT